jgi:hypothetical protein
MKCTKRTPKQEKRKRETPAKPKILANRIKPLLSQLVGKQQTAFVEGRRIADNIFLAQELLWNYLQNQILPRCALKVDLRRLVILFDGIFS